MQNEKNLLTVFRELKQKLDNEDFVIDKSGVKTVEVLAPKIILNPEEPILKFNGRKTPEKYAEKELEWYLSQDLNVKHIKNVAKIWDNISSKCGFINSNYGYLVFHPSNHDQFGKCVEELNRNRETRRAVHIYTRPSMQYEYNRDGMSDFICTFAHQFFIRDGKLHSIVNMRSQDGIYGLFNDFYWFAWVHRKVYNEVHQMNDLSMGEIIHIPNSFHVYEKHFDMLNKICETKV